MNESLGIVETKGYVGNVERQDGVELLIRAARLVADELGRETPQFTCIGSGSDLGRLRSVARALDLEDVLEFTGRLPHDKALERLSVCDICVQPDPSNAFNDSCTMVKSLEYMALGKPVVAFDLRETRHACGDAALYARPNSASDLAAKVIQLVRNPALRRRLGRAGTERIERELSWETGEAALLRAYASLAFLAGRPGISRRRRGSFRRPLRGRARRRPRPG